MIAPIASQHTDVDVPSNSFYLKLHLIFHVIKKIQSKAATQTKEHSTAIKQNEDNYSIYVTKWFHYNTMN